jgi:O-antigen/teichoic acid export membrane protein
VLLSAAAIAATGTVATTYLFAAEKTRVVFLSGALGAVLAVVVGLAIVPTYGAMAAAIGRGVIQVFVVLVALWYIESRLGCRTPFRSLGLLLVAALACGAAALGVVLTVQGPATLPLAIAAGALVYILAVRVLRPLPASDLAYLSAACAGLPGRLGRPMGAFIAFLSPR